ncbi:tetratricopeptide repeat protein [Streptomyces sp. NPDC090108]|uniref:tetratricopeptide repeat protein n=1 Tax=Streptomyces sp. NPDC090108 TaxID=3365947 RepID=UPI003804BBB8
MSRLSFEKKRAQAPVAHPATVRVRVSGAGTASVDGTAVTAAPGEDVQQAVLNRLHRLAISLGAPVNATIHDDRTGCVVPLEVATDGSSRVTGDPVRLNVPAAPRTPAAPSGPVVLGGPVPDGTTATPAGTTATPAGTTAAPATASAPAALPAQAAPPAAGVASAPGTVQAPTGVFGPAPVMDPVRGQGPGGRRAGSAYTPGPDVTRAGRGTGSGLPVLPEPGTDLAAAAAPAPPRGFDAVAEEVLCDEPVTETAEGAELLAGPLAQINEAVREGRTEEAAELAGRAVAEASAVLGPRHREVLRLRELSAYIAWLEGDPVRAFTLSLDTARGRRALDDAAGAYGDLQSAATAWRAVRDPGQGLRMGRDLIGLWAALAAEPGPAADDPRPLESARARMARLTDRAAAEA